MPVFYVYMLRCTDSQGKKSVYTGSTQDLLVRVEQHKTGKGARYTKGKELELVFFETLLSRSEAMKREYAIKQLSTKQKESLIQEFQAKMKEISSGDLECEK